jgi:hypothetical protein
MTVPRLLILLAASAATLLAGAAEPAAANKPPADAAKPIIETGPAVGWVFPLFTDKEGYHRLTLHGDTARVVGPDQIDVTGFSAVVFSGDATERVDTVLLSPQATFFPKENLAKGASAVRLILNGKDPSRKDDIEVIGRGWTYDHAAKRVSLAHDVRVTFQTQLHDILK